MVFLNTTIIDRDGDTLRERDFLAFKATHSTLVADLGVRVDSQTVLMIPKSTLIPVAKMDVYRALRSPFTFDVVASTATTSKTIASLSLEAPPRAHVGVELSPRRHGELLVFAERADTHEKLPLTVIRSNYPVRYLSDIPDLAPCRVANPRCFQARIEKLEVKPATATNKR